MSITEEDVNKQLNKEFEDFSASVYQGKLIDNFTDHFRKAIVNIPLHEIQIPASKIKDMINKKKEDLTVMEVGYMTNIISKTSLTNIGKGILFLEEIQKTIAEYNERTKVFKTSLSVKKDAQMRIINPPKNGMRIIGKA